jgi:hypothetical protein
MAKTGVDLELDEHRGIMAGPEDLLVPDSSLKELVQE